MYSIGEPGPDRTFWLSSLLKVVLLFVCVITPRWLSAQTISGTIQDSTGAVIAGARIEITGGDLPQPILLMSDGLGKFVSLDLEPATYSVRVSHEGFEPLLRSVDLRASVQLQLTLSIAKAQVSISVAGKSLAFMNSDPVYRQLRDVGLGQTFRFDNFTLTWDVATFQFLKGTLTFLAPVNGVVTGAIFIGEGHFSLKPAIPLDAHELTRRINAAEVTEDFTEAVFRFTRTGHMQFLPGGGEPIETPAEAGILLHHWRETRPTAPRAGFRFHSVPIAGRNHG
jgi:Carboxypeptidase regulatory-like domain